MEKYHLAIGKKQLGEYTKEELSKVELTKNHIVWNGSMEQWNKIVDVKELASLLKPIPPLTPSQEKMRVNRHSFVKSFKMGVWWFIISGLLLFTITGGFASNSYLTRRYIDQSNSPIWGTGNEIRFIIFICSFLLVAVPISLIMIFSQKRKIEQPLKISG